MGFGISEVHAFLKGATVGTVKKIKDDGPELAGDVIELGYDTSTIGMADNLLDLGIKDSIIDFFG